MRQPGHTHMERGRSPPERPDELGGTMSILDERWADQPEKRLARDAGEYPEGLQGRADVPEQIAKDAGMAPEIVDRPVIAHEYIATASSDADRREELPDQKPGL